ncbi:predicted protein [Chaetoceros tenuissimus]|uniref:Uncharacterized protein n=1 Tax=Chaetoceros tenuissimus TaxID=426638 RepID=A0AAD3HAJ7_9STRA|nr:predicted protein [Chaetoceros tenuissimus]
MVTDEYLEKLNNAIPYNDRVHEGPTIEDLRGLAIKLLKKGNGPPAIADSSAPTINVIADFGTCCNQIRLLWWDSLSGTKNVSMSYCNDFLEDMGFDIPSSEKHYVWRYKESEATIHIGEANIDRALYDIGVQMVLRVMKEGLIRRIFDNRRYANENYSIFDDDRIPKNVDEGLAWNRHEEEKSLLKISDFDSPASYNKEVMRLFSIAKKKILLSTLKSRFLENATRMVSKEVHFSDTIVSDDCNCLLLSLPLEIQKRILFCLCSNKMYAENRPCHWRCNENMGCYKMKELVQFGLTSKSCH